MSVIVLVKDLAWVGAVGNEWNTDWISFPAEHQNALLVIVVKTFSAGQVSVRLQTTWDTDQALEVGAAAIALSATGIQTQNITSLLGPMVRLNMESTGGAAAVLMFSAYLTPKSD